MELNAAKSLMEMAAKAGTDFEVGVAKVVENVEALSKHYASPSNRP